MSTDLRIAKSHGLEINQEDAKTMGDFAPLPAELLLYIFNKFDQASLVKASRLNLVCRGIVVAGMSWGGVIKAFRIFNSALSAKNIIFNTGRTYLLDLTKQKCIFEEIDRNETRALAERPLPIPFPVSKTFALSSTSVICISEDRLACGRLDIDKENFSVSFSPLPPFLSSLPGIEIILDPFPPMAEIYGFDIYRKDNDLQITLRINPRERTSEHFLLYEIDPTKPSSCYLGRLKDYCRNEGAGVVITKIEKIAVEDELRVIKQIDVRGDRRREHPRKVLREVLGFSGNWLLIQTFNFPGSDHRCYFLNRNTFSVEECFASEDRSLSMLKKVYAKENFRIFLFGWDAI